MTDPATQAERDPVERQNAPCGCARVYVAGRWWQVNWCPEHHDGCPDDAWNTRATAGAGGEGAE